MASQGSPRAPLTRPLGNPARFALAIMAAPIRTRLALRTTLAVLGLTFMAGLLAMKAAEGLAQRAAANPADAPRQVASAIALLRIGIPGLTLALGLALALLVSWTLVRPMTDLSRRVHSRRAEPGAPLVAPRGHAHDELGRLTREVNALVGRLEQALGREQELSGRLTLDQRKSKAILDHVGTGIFVVRGDGTLESWTPALLRLLDQGALAPDPEVPFHLLFGPASIQAEVCLRNCQLEGARQVDTFRLPERDAQSHRWLKLTLDPIGPDWIQGQLEDITSFRDDALAAQELAIRDPLTGAFNRLGAERALQERLGPSRGPLAVMLLDLDRFKLVNDTCGHAVGDEVLREVVVRMKAGLRHSDVLARLGGDEFLIVLDDIQTEDAARAIAQNLIRALNHPITLAGFDPIQVGASLGIAFGGGPEALTRADLLKRADQAMYEAKQAGRNRCRFFQG